MRQGQKHWPVPHRVGRARTGRMAGHLSAQSGLYGVMIYCRVRVCYVISDLNLRDVMALLHSLGVGKRLCIAFIFHKGPCVHLYCIKLPQII